MKLVVSNTTPISNLLRIQQLPLLRLLFERVLIPGQVAAELTRGQSLLGDDSDMSALSAHSFNSSNRLTFESAPRSGSMF